MKIKRLSTSETVQLEDGFLWSDEFTWKPIEQNFEYSMSGAPIIQEGLKQDGRSIVLEPADSDMGWIKRRDLQKLLTWSALQERFSLEFEWPHDRRKFNVIFNHGNGALDAKPVKGIPTVSEDDYYNVTMRFLELNDD